MTLRWRFPDPSEEQARRRVLASIDAFWAAFREQQASLLDGVQTENIPELSWMGKHLKAIHPALSWEISFPGRSQRQLAISTEGHRELGPLLGVILERAPHDLPWDLVGEKPPKNLDEASQFLAQVTGGSLDGWTCRVELAPHHQIAIHYGIPGCKGPKDRDAHLRAMAATDALLGGALFERWIGAVHILPAEQFEGGEGLEGLLSKVEEAKNFLLQKLPGKPVYAAIEEASWNLYRFNPRRRDAYPFRIDLVVGKSVYPELWQCVHARVSCYSQRFSRLGETFCYLKIDTEEGLGEGGFEDKSEIEDALDEALGEARLGCVIGGGSGLRYGYIDLALMDVGAAAEIISRVLREGKAPRRTWLLFFDDDLAAEWIAFRPKTPPPP